MKGRAAHAFFWSGADTIIRQAIFFGVSITLARLLSPEDFGVVALSQIFVALAGVFIDAGFSAALIQRRQITQADKSTVFWFNIFAAIVASVAIILLAEPAARFYSIPVLRPLIALMALNLLLSSLASVHTTLLSKSLDFRTQTTAGVAASAVSGAIAVAAAVNGMGVWAIAAQILTSTILHTSLLWILNPWRPSFHFQVSSLRQLFRFGGSMFASAILEVFFTRGYMLTLGKLFGVAELGFYSRAESAKQLPVGILTSIVNRVALPLFSSATDKVELRNGVRRSARLMMFVNIPLMSGLIAVAEPLINLLFGPQWGRIVPLFQVLCLGAILWPLHVVNLTALTAMGYSGLFLKLEIAKKIIGVCILGGASMFGLFALAWGQVFFGIIALIINTRYTERILGYGLRAQMLDCWPTAVITLPVAVLVWMISETWMTHPLVEVAGLSIVGVSGIVALCWMFRVSAFTDAISILVKR